MNKLCICVNRIHGIWLFDLCNIYIHCYLYLLIHIIVPSVAGRRKIKNRNPLTQTHTSQKECVSSWINITYANIVKHYAQHMKEYARDQSRISVTDVLNRGDKISEVDVSTGL